MALDYTMVATYGTFAKDDRQLAAWGNAVNLNLDDKISKTNSAIQAIASQIDQNGLLNMGANIDLNANNLIVASGGDKTITAADLAFLVGLNQFLTTGSAAEFLTLKIGTLAGVLKASGGNVSGGADTDDLPVGATNKYYTTALHNVDFDTRLATKTTDNLTEHANAQYYTNEKVDDRVNSLLQNGTEVQWSYDDGANTLTPVMTNDTIAVSRLAYATLAQILVAGSGGIWTPRAMGGDGSINGSGDLTVNNDSHEHTGNYLTKDELKTLLGIGSSNKKWVTAVYRIPEDADDGRFNLPSAHFGAIVDIDTSASHFAYDVPLPSQMNFDGTVFNLTISKVRMHVQGDASNYVDLIYAVRNRNNSTLTNASVSVAIGNSGGNSEWEEGIVSRAVVNAQDTLHVVVRTFSNSGTMPIINVVVVEYYYA